MGGLAGKKIGGTISNVKIINPKITGYENVGGFFGWNSGDISECTMEQGTGEIKGHINVGGFGNVVNMMVHL